MEICLWKNKRGKVSGWLYSGLGMGIRASYTVEAAGLMALIFFTIMILLNQAFHVHAETSGCFATHEAVESERHKIENQDEPEISRQVQGMRWSLDLTASVFSPEKTLRMWSLAE